MELDPRIEKWLDTKARPETRDAVLSLHVVAEDVLEFKLKGDDLMIQLSGVEGAGEEKPAPGEPSSSKITGHGLVVTARLKETALMREMCKVRNETPRESLQWLARGLGRRGDEEAAVRKIAETNLFLARM